MWTHQEVVALSNGVRSSDPEGRDEVSCDATGPIESRRNLAPNEIWLKRAEVNVRPAYLESAVAATCLVGGRRDDVLAGLRPRRQPLGGRDSCNCR